TPTDEQRNASEQWQPPRLRQATAASEARRRSRKTDGSGNSITLDDVAAVMTVASTWDSCCGGGPISLRCVLIRKFRLWKLRFHDEGKQHSAPPSMTSGPLELVVALVRDVAASKSSSTATLLNSAAPPLRRCIAFCLVDAPSYSCGICLRSNS
ncbi:hypothetical protein V5799_011957, partial [Amblyomma americanum]